MPKNQFKQLRNNQNDLEIARSFMNDQIIAQIIAQINAQKCLELSENGWDSCHVFDMSDINPVTC